MTILDLRAGLSVGLIALPLSLGIALASGFPASSGIVTAVVGGLVAGLLGGARGTIKGPAAGLIVLVLAAVTDLGVRGALAAFVLAGLLQVLMGLGRATRFTSLVPAPVVHGMMAAIGLLVLFRQLPVMLGVASGLRAGEPLEVVGTAAFAGGVAFVLVVGSVIGATRWPWLARVPAPLVAVGAAALVAAHLGLGAHPEAARLFPALPGSVSAWVLLPDLSVLADPRAVFHALVLATVGALESSLTVRAIDSITGRQSDLDRDLVAVGLANVGAACLGGLPMISEVVRSTANVQQGARSGWSNVVHGAFLLVAVGAFGSWLAHVPLAALAALLVVVGAKLAAPSTFRRELSLGAPRMLAFSATVSVTLVGDLLLGIGAGVLVALLGRAWERRRSSRGEVAEERVAIAQPPGP